MKNVNAEIEKAFGLLSEANREAYKDLFLISNAVLSKNPFNNNFLKRFVSGEEVKRRPFYTVPCKLVLYYMKSALHFMMYLSKFCEYLFSGARFHIRGCCEELILIDVPFLMERISSSGSFSDPYFPGLEDLFKKLGKNFAYLPFFYSSFYNKRPLELFATLRILKRDKVPALTEYQLLTLSDIVRLAFFVAVYPFRVLGFLRTLNTSDDRGMFLLKDELVDTLDDVTFHAYSRYLQGRRIARLACGRIKIISWYENQTIHKNLYKGSRALGSKTQIFGAQLFLYSRNNLNMIPDENEREFGVLPDVIVVNGRFFMPQKTRLNYTPGPSMRYAGVFKTVSRAADRKNVLVLLPYYADDGEFILKMLAEMGAGGMAERLIIRPHPAIPMKRYGRRPPSGASVEGGDLYELLKSAKVVIGMSSGTLVEAASLGIPAISVRNPGKFDFSNPLPEYGKGLIWAEASNVEEMAHQLKAFDSAAGVDKEKMDQIAAAYKEMFFCEASEENMIKAFDL